MSRARIWSIVVILVSCAASVLAIVRAQTLSCHSGMIDFYQFWLVGQFVDQPGYERIYDLAVYDRIGSAGMQFADRSSSARMKAAAKVNAELYPHKIEPISTPALYAVFKLFSCGDFETDASRYQLICTLAFAGGIVAIARAVRLNWPAASIALAAILNWFGPFKVDILDGNTARLQLAGLGAAVAAIALAPRRAGRILGGFLLAVGIVFKPNLLLCAVVLLASDACLRRWRAAIELLIGLITGIAISVIATSLYVHGFALWGQWIAAIRAAGSSHASVYSLANQNCSFARIISEALGYDVSWLVLAGAFLAFAAPLIQSVTWVSGPGERPAHGPEAPVTVNRSDPHHRHSISFMTSAIGAGALMMLISSPIVWPSYFLFMLPTMLSLARPARVGTTAIVRWTLVAVAFLCVAASSGPWLDMNLRTLVIVLGLVNLAMLVVSSVFHMAANEPAR